MGSISSLLVIGSAGGTAVAGSLQAAALSMGLRSVQLNSDAAYAGTRPQRLFNWHLRGRRPNRLVNFSQQVLSACQTHRPSVSLSTGIAPVSAKILREIRRHGVKTVNFLTDDPWNAAHYAPWFLDALPQYDQVFTPRRSIVDAVPLVKLPVRAPNGQKGRAFCE